MFRTSLLSNCKLKNGKILHCCTHLELLSSSWNTHVPANLKIGIQFIFYKAFTISLQTPDLVAPVMEVLNLFLWSKNVIFIKIDNCKTQGE